MTTTTSHAAIERATQVYEALTAPGNFEPFAAMEIALRRSGLLDDAERYNWLRERDLDTIHKGGVFAGMTPKNVVLNGDDLDMAVDAAIAKAQGSCDTCGWKIGLECNQPHNDEQYCRAHDLILWTATRRPPDPRVDIIDAARRLVAELDAAGAILSDDGRPISVIVTDTVLRDLRKSVEQAG